MNQSFIYLRGLRSVDHSVFCVEQGQKYYWDSRFTQRVAYSSGQQVKRSIIESILTYLNQQPAPVTFYFEGSKLKEKEVTTPANPEYTDQLLGGWMVSKSGGGRTIKRRSPLSISAMRPLHPLLSGVYEEDISFDRSDRPGIHKVVVKDDNGNILTDEQIADLLEGSDRSLRRKWIQDNRRTSGLFVYDVAIDLRTLFCVLTSPLEPELNEENVEKLKQNGWKESKNVFGKCLVCPKERREKIIEALAHGLINWRITSNQSRTFSIMENLAIAISNNANKIAGSIRGKLLEETGRPKATPIIDDTAGAELFISLPCDSYIKDVHGTANALNDAEKRLIDLLKNHDYENQ